MRRLLLLGLLWLFCLGSLGGCGSGSDDASGDKKDVHKRSRKGPSPTEVK